MELGHLNRPNTGLLNEHELKRIVRLCEISADGCWLWTGSFDAKPPRFLIKRDGEWRSFSVRRLVFQHFIGPIDGKYVDQSCGKLGCINPEHLFLKDQKKRHGPLKSKVGRRATVEHKRTYTSWCEMKSRCTSPNRQFYYRYGGRGIRVCDRWMESFWNFLEDMGPRPEGTSLDRIDNDGNYEPGNCRWVNQKTQGRNTRRAYLITARGRSLCAPEWEEVTGIPAIVIWQRIKKLGWDEERAVFTPVTPKWKHLRAPANNQEGMGT